MSLDPVRGPFDRIQDILNKRLEDTPPAELHWWAVSLIQKLEATYESKTRQGQATIRNYHLLINALRSKNSQWKSLALEAQDSFQKLLLEQRKNVSKPRRSIAQAAVAATVGAFALLGLTNRKNETPTLSSVAVTPQIDTTPPKIVDPQVWEAASNLSEKRKERFLLTANRLLHLLPTYVKAANEAKVPAALALAITTQESEGDSTARSPTGPVGLGQFTRLTGKQYFERIPKKGEMSTFESDDRLHGSKSAVAIVQHLAYCLNVYNGYKDQYRLAIAENNGGGIQLREAIYQVSLKKQIEPKNVMWEDVAQELLQLPQEYPFRDEKFRETLNSDSTVKMAKRLSPEETVAYVPAVTDFWQTWERIIQAAGSALALANYAPPETNVN